MTATTYEIIRGLQREVFDLKQANKQLTAERDAAASELKEAKFRLAGLDK